MQKLYALVDCNNFFVSCERVFQPHLNGKPVAVLSNNDGCMVSRSNEVKALGIPMGAPVFKWRPLIERHNVQLFSSNFILYGNMSRRIMLSLSEYAADIEIYSIDEAFLSFEGIQNPTQYARTIRNKILQWTGIPVSIGIAPTKTLAKAANEIAKKHPEYNGVLKINEHEDDLLEKLPVEDVWGVGRKTAKKLSLYGIKTARDLKYMPDDWVKKRLSIVGLRMLHELRGISCLSIEKMRPAKKGISSTRSFGRPVTTLRELKEAISFYIIRATERLRAQKSVAGYVRVFVQTNRFNKENYYYNIAGMQLIKPTADTRVLIKYAKHLLGKIYKEGLQYKRAGVFLTDITPANREQLSLFSVHQIENPRLMHTMDELNNKWGDRVITFAAAGIKRPWKMKHLQSSQYYTTKWDELLVIKLNW